MAKTTKPNTKRKTKTHLTEQIKTNIISLLIEGYSVREVTRRLKKNNTAIISYQTVQNVKQKNLTHIDKVKKQNREDLLKSDNEKYKEVVSGFLDVSRRAIKHITDQKLKDSSGAALSTIAGISIDKHTVATGGVTDRTEVKFKNRSAMIGYIKGNGKDGK